ncbi:DUF6615 family protein [Telluribacter sp. SYSU D00476]|uniref:DUF6615 family protein n=1 Tax=Telluribacter sp. SYSU D00476 TaxID=2811430 RepID=UPI001FF6CB83|nr:DUF6615 family protein [Telluribacter sp. SYSU D00476]
MDRINSADSYGTIYGEETITDLILLELARQNYFNIRILQTPKPFEAIKGTDWEWFVGSNNFGWIRYAIHAKKLDLSTGRYKILSHKVGKPPKDEYQIKVLRDFAHANGAVPLNNFYNYFPKATQADHWHCQQDFDRELLGWTFTPLKNVEKAINTRGSRTFDKIHRFSSTLPIRCLFKCPFFRDLYRDTTTLSQDGDFFGETFRKVARLSNEFINAREIGILQYFPHELYNSQVGIYPKRIAIIDLRLSE